MLRRILEEIRASTEPVNLSELSRKLDIDRSALDGMLLQLVRLGKPREIPSEKSDYSHCGGACACSQTPTAERRCMSSLNPREFFCRVLDMSN
jgi:hypothetical protein